MSYADGTNPISNTENVIDSREVIARIDYLRTLATDMDCVTVDLTMLDDGERAELASLEVLASEAEGYAADWNYGAILLRDSYFEDVAARVVRGLAEESGVVNAEATWPLYCIDWERAADDLRMDYTAVDFHGVTYWVR